MSKITQENLEMARNISEELANFAGYNPKARMRTSFIGYALHLIFKAIQQAYERGIEDGMHKYCRNCENGTH